MTIQKSNRLSANKRSIKKRMTLTFSVSVCLLVIFVYLNLATGTLNIQTKDMYHYFFTSIENKQTFIIQSVRMPRMIVAILVGGALALAGLLMQSITRNPLASPQIFGVNAGASFIIVLVTVLMPTMGNYATYLAFIGAFIGGLTVYLLSGSTKKITPVKLALAGMAVHLFFSSLTQGIILLNEDSNSTVMFWLVGSLNGMKWKDVMIICPWILMGLIILIAFARQLTIMELGDTLAKSLGQKTEVIRIIIGLLVIIFAGTSVSIVGPIGFIGLIVPHIVKRYAPHNYFILIPLTFIVGANLLLLSDTLSRLITYPYESPVGIITSFIGAFYFLFITLRRVKRI